MKHAMIDLETLDSVPGGVILSIGAVMFDPTKTGDERLGEEFYCVVNTADCVAHGLNIDPDTQAWWAKQSAEARLVLTQAQDPEQSDTLEDALEMFADFLPKGCTVWSNGGSFDQPFLAVAYRKIGKKAPWDHWNGLCHRTIMRLCKDEKAIRPATVLAHNALEDAKWQARHLCNVANLLKITL